MQDNIPQNRHFFKKVIIGKTMNKSLGFMFFTAVIMIKSFVQISNLGKMGTQANLCF